MHASLKIQFQVGSILFKIAKFSKKNLPPTPTFQHPQLCIWALNPNSASPILFASSNPFQNGMTHARWIKTMEEIDFCQKAWVQARAYPVGMWQVYYPQKVIAHQPSNPWKFHSNWRNCSKANQHFLKHRITLTTQPLGTPRGPQIKKRTNMHLLKFNFGSGIFYKELPNRVQARAYPGD